MWEGNGQVRIFSLGATISYDKNAPEGKTVSGRMNSHRTGLNTTVALRKCAFECDDGTEFKGWALTPDGDVVYTDEQSIFVDKDITLYAVWNENYKIIYDKNPPNSNTVSGSMEDTEFKSGEEVSLRENQYSCNGYVFKGWSKTPTGSVEYTDQQKVSFEGDTTLYAVWEANKYSVNVYPNKPNESSSSISCIK